MTTTEGTTMPENFNAEIELGNDAMQDRDDVADALEQIAERLREGFTVGGITDVNGNTVGAWSLT